DNRDFSNSIGAEARIHAEITIDFTGPTPVVSSKRPKVLKCSKSERFRISDGELLNSGVGIVKGDLVPDPSTMSAGSTKVPIKVDLAANKPVARGPILVPIAGPIPVPVPVPTRFDPPPPPELDPDIDIEGTISIDVLTRTVGFTGKVDRFPFFEMYASKD